MATIKKGNDKCWPGGGEIGTLVLGMQTGAAAVESTMVGPQQVKYGLSMWSSGLRGNLHIVPVLIAASSPIVQTKVVATQVSIGG